MTIKLHGMSLSNYYNVIKCVMLEKEVLFEEVAVKPNQESDYLSKSPMGKVPCMETTAGFMTETSVMLEYLEDINVGKSLYPADSFQRAKCRELMRYLELYIELPARRLYGDVFFWRPASDGEKDAVKKILEKGFLALGRLAKFDHCLSRKPRLEDISRIGSILAAMSSALAFNPISAPDFSLISAE